MASEVYNYTNPVRVENTIIPFVLPQKQDVEEKRLLQTAPSSRGEKRLNRLSKYNLSETSQKKSSPNNVIDFLISVMAQTLANQVNITKVYGESEQNQAKMGEIILKALKENEEKTIANVKKMVEEQEHASWIQKILKVVSIVVTVIAVGLCFATGGASMGIAAGITGAISSSGALDKLTKAMGISNPILSAVVKVLLVVALTVATCGAATAITATSAGSEAVAGGAEAGAEAAEAGAEAAEEAGAEENAAEPSSYSKAMSWAKANKFSLAMTGAQYSATLNPIQDFMTAILEATPTGKKKAKEIAAITASVINAVISLVAALSIGKAATSSLSEGEGLASSFKQTAQVTQSVGQVFEGSSEIKVGTIEIDVAKKTGAIGKLQAAYQLLQTITSVQENLLTKTENSMSGQAKNITDIEKAFMSLGLAERTAAKILAETSA